MKFKKLKIVARRSLSNSKSVVSNSNLTMHSSKQRKRANIKIHNKKIKRCKVSHTLGEKLFKHKTRNLIYQQTHNKSLTSSFHYMQKTAKELLIYEYHTQKRISELIDLNGTHLKVSNKQITMMFPIVFFLLIFCSETKALYSRYQKL